APNNPKATFAWRHEAPPYAERPERVTRRDLRRSANGALLWVPMPLPLSVSIVCRNSEATIGRTLDSVAGLASEIVAVDSGSTDGTIALRERHGARVIRSDWKGYVAPKQMALDACTQPWVLSLDSDESIDGDLRRAIEAAVQAHPPAADGYRIRR